MGGSTIKIHLLKNNYFKRNLYAKSPTPAKERVGQSAAEFHKSSREKSMGLWKQELSSHPKLFIEKKNFIIRNLFSLDNANEMCNE